MNTKYQASTDIEKEDLSSITQEIWREPYIPSIPFIHRKKCQKMQYTGTAASERRKAVGVFLELLMHVICIRLNVRVTLFSFIPLGETFTLEFNRKFTPGRAR